jgi:hypothetical protein
MGFDEMFIQMSGIIEPFFAEVTRGMTKKAMGWISFITMSSKIRFGVIFLLP